jgi:hypothetical protein
VCAQTKQWQRRRRRRTTILQNDNTQQINKATFFLSVQQSECARNEAVAASSQASYNDFTKRQCGAVEGAYM